MPRFRDGEIGERIREWNELICIGIFGVAWFGFEVFGVEHVGWDAGLSKGYFGGKFGEHVG